MRKVIIITISIFFCLFIGSSVSAQKKDALALSITPPLIKNNVNPGQVWKSAIKIMNHNPVDIEIHIEIADFEGGSENGTVKFITNDDPNESGYLLSDWIVIDREPITIPANQSKEIEFIIDVPEGASPGGHYAAILAGTGPGEGEQNGSAIKISSLLGSLMLLKVNGDVVEEGNIREFSTDKSVYTDSNAKFTVRFENVGNVHIQPQGEIRIYNMAGKERGVFSINYDTEFGNVLPNEIRQWNFDWEGESSLLEMGRYRAELILGYGSQARSHDDRTLYFWVIFVKPVLIIFSIIVFTILFIVLIVRASIKRAIRQAQSSVLSNSKNVHKIKVTSDVGNVVDLKNVVKDNNKKENRENKEDKKIINKDKKMIKWSFFKKMAILIIAILFFISGIFLYVYLNKYSVNKIKEQVKDITPEKVSDNERDSVEQKVEIINQKMQEEDDTKQASTSEDVIIEDDMKNDENDEDIIEDEVKELNKNIDIRILNGSGISGVAGKVSGLINSSGYKNIDTGNASNFNYKEVLIKYQEESLLEAEEIKSLFKETVKMEETDDIDVNIVIIVGANFQ